MHKYSRYICKTLNQEINHVTYIASVVLIGVWLLGFMALPAYSQEDYLIGPEDKLNIIVWGHDDLKRELPVSLEGNISFPLIGIIKAADKTTSQLEKEIAKKLADGYVVNPQVTVTVSEDSSQKFFIMGEIEKPGKYNLESGMNVLMAISMGGGLTPKAAQKRTKIIRVVGGRETEFRVTMDTVVKPGDTIIVPESFF
ncbi:MAG: polysaccharide export protein [Deltaproteobacteria bacterium]|nr:polysaccharide export protein [Deltaproteobacteria bacterium]